MEGFGSDQHTPAGYDQETRALISPALVDTRGGDADFLHDVQVVLLLTRPHSSIGMAGFGSYLLVLKVQPELVKCCAHRFLEGSRPA